MRKFFMAIFFSICAFANSLLYKIVTEKYDEYGERGQVVKFYDGDKLVLSFVLNETGGDCLKKEYQEGVYLFKGDKLYLYTRWYGYDLNGYKKSVFHINKDKTLKKISSEFWIKEPSQDIDSLESIYKSRYITDPKKQRDLKNEYEEAKKEFVKSVWSR